MNACDNKYNYFLYDEGGKNIRFQIDCRYRFLQFVGYINAAVLAFGFSQNILFSAQKAIAGIAICSLSVFIALMGLATEFSVSSYVRAYYSTLRQIENELKGSSSIVLVEGGHDTVGKSSFHKLLPVNRAHKFFYGSLIVFWLAILIYQIRL